MNDEPVTADSDLAVLVRMLDAVSDRMDVLDDPAGEDVGAQENRTIRQSRARLARDEASQVRTGVEEVRRRARELARRAGALRAGSEQLTGRIAAGTGDPVLAAARAADAARRAPDRESGRARRLVEQALSATPATCWAQLAVPEGTGVMTWSAGELPAAAVESVESGPRAAVLGGAASVAVAGCDDRWPELAVATAGTHVHGVLAVRLGRGPVPGALVLAVTGPDAFDEQTRLVVHRLAEHAASALLGGDRIRPDRAEAEDVLAGARAVLGWHLGVDPDETFGMLLDVSQLTGQPVLDVARRILRALVPRAPGTDVVTGEPTVLRRATAFMDRHALEQIHVDDVATEAGIGVRGLQNLFRQHRGITPLTYLRTVRLDRAHAELQAARPTSGITVNTVAARWHFTNPGRFSAIYRERFGVLPSHTLRT